MLHPVQAICNTSHVFGYTKVRVLDTFRSVLHFLMKRPLCSRTLSPQNAFQRRGRTLRFCCDYRYPHECDQGSGPSENSGMPEKGVIRGLELSIWTWHS